jgi:transcriptional regulator with XRE-family HTH domain
MDGVTLKGWRKRARLTQKELARLLGVHPMAVAFWEWGKRGIPPFLHLALKALDMEFQKGDRNGTANRVPGVQKAKQPEG